MAVSETHVDTEPPQARHDWIQIAVGRVCQKCRIVQMKGEFSDDDACGEPASDEHRRRRPPEPTR